MLTFFLRRLFAVPPLLLVISLLTYLLLQAAPGDFFSRLESDPKYGQDYVMRLRESVGKVVSVPPAQRAAALGEFEIDGRRYGFDADGRLLVDGAVAEPRNEQQRIKRFELEGEHAGRWTITVEGAVYRSIGTLHGYFAWLKNIVLHADFGQSYQAKAPVGEVISEKVANTLALEIFALSIAWGLAIPLGVWSGVRPNSAVDHACGALSYMSLSVPTVFLALLALLFAYTTKWFPVGDMHDVQADKLSWGARQLDTLHHIALPALVIGITSIAVYMRQMRGQMVETMSADYVRTARAKGLSRNKVVFKHALRNAINPLVTLFGFSLAALLSGSFLVEVVFNWPGLARTTVEAIFAKDEPLVMASVLMATLLLVAGNLIADVLLAVVDPKIRLE